MHIEVQRFSSDASGEIKHMLGQLGNALLICSDQVKYCPSVPFLTFLEPLRIQESKEGYGLMCPSEGSEPHFVEVERWESWVKQKMIYTLHKQNNQEQGRNIFITNSNHYGVGPAGPNSPRTDASAAKFGDHIVLLVNLDLPIILRPDKDGYYKFIGPAYISRL